MTDARVRELERRWRAAVSLGEKLWLKLSGWVYTFSLFVLLAPLFRSPDFGTAWTIYARSITEFGLPQGERFGLLFVALAFAVDALWRGQTRLDQGLRLAWLGRAGKEIAETLLFATAMILVLVNAVTRQEANAFIYFQF